MSCSRAYFDLGVIDAISSMTLGLSQLIPEGSESVQCAVFANAGLFIEDYLMFSCLHTSRMK